MLVTPEEGALLLQLAERHRVTVPRLLAESALSCAGKTPTERRNAIVEAGRPTPAARGHRSVP